MNSKALTLTALAALALLFTACADLPANAPNELIALGNARATGTAQAQVAIYTAAPVTQSFVDQQYAQSLTATFVPPALTATANANIATQDANRLNAERATTEALYNAGSVTATLAALTVLESDTQRTLAENDKAIADSIRWGNFWQSVLEWGALIIIFALSISATWSVIQFGLFAYTFRLEREKELRKLAEWREYNRAQDKAGSEFLLTSGGLVAKSHPVVTVAEAHIADYQRANNWRAVLKTYVASCIELERGGVRQPYSRPNCLTYKLIQDPATARPWQLGHDRVIALLRELKVVDNTGKGGSTRLIVDVSEFARVIDLAPLPNLPPDPIPHAKIMVAGWQLAQEVAG